MTVAKDPRKVRDHRFSECWDSWRSQISVRARAGFRVIAPDLRGDDESGRSEGTEVAETLPSADDFRFLRAVVFANAGERTFGVRHGVQQGAPARLNALLLAFLQKSAGSRGGLSAR